MDSFTDVLALVKQYGPYLAVLVFFVWKDYAREHRLEARIDSLQDFVQDELLQALERNNEILAQWRIPTSDDR